MRLRKRFGSRHQTEISARMGASIESAQINCSHQRFMIHRGGKRGPVGTAVKLPGQRSNMFAQSKRLPEGFPPNSKRRHNAYAGNNDPTH
jgi:hypothetical protein